MTIIVIQLLLFFLYTKVLIRNLHFKSADLFFFLVIIPATLILTKFGQVIVTIGMLLLLIIYFFILTKSFKASIAIAAIDYITNNKGYKS